jgi:hypothetical protein
MVETTRNTVSQESGVRSQESGVRSQESGVRSQESGVRSQESGVIPVTVLLQRVSTTTTTDTTTHHRPYPTWRMLNTIYRAPEKVAAPSSTQAGSVRIQASKMFLSVLA